MRALRTRGHCAGRAIRRYSALRAAARCVVAPCLARPSQHPRVRPTAVSRMMSIDWNAFTPWPALAGGVLIGVAAAMFVLLNGRVAGISGVIGGLLKPARGDIAWRAAFVLGLVGAPLVYRLISALPKPQIDAEYAALVVAGLLVGVGTRYGAGCTSGHGVCGLSRLSPRSLVATTAFMMAGFATVFVMRHLFSM
ncbi:MAG: YeeE/YedE family protein [Polaromonas sp.]